MIFIGQPKLKEDRKLPHKTFSSAMGEYLADSNAKEIDKYSAHVVTAGNDDTIGNFFACLANMLVENAIIRYFMTDDTPRQVLELYYESASAAANFFKLKLSPGKQLRYEWRNQSYTILVPDKITGHIDHSILWRGLTSALIANNREKLEFLVQVSLDTLDEGNGPFELRVMALQSLCRGDELSQTELFDQLRGFKPSRNLDSKMMHAMDQTMLALCGNDPTEVSSAIAKCLSTHARFYDNDSRNMRFNVHGLISSDMLAMLALASRRRIRLFDEFDSAYLPRELMEAALSRIGPDSPW